MRQAAFSKPGHAAPGPASSYDLEPVDLEELGTVAALQTRVDRKYVIDGGVLDPLFTHLAAKARILDIDGRRCFAYQSTYYDTPEFLTYLDAARSRPSRFKIRVRSYLDHGTHFTEVKSRNRSRRTVKSRQPTSAAAHHILDRSSRSFVADAIRSELGDAPGRSIDEAANVLTPTLRTRFRRTTLLVEPPTERASVQLPMRATIDTDLEFDGMGRQTRIDRRLCVIETKTAGPPSPIDQLLWRAGHRPTTFSKYGCGLALLHPHLPATKWNRVLRRQFGWQPNRRPRGGTVGTAAAEQD